MMKSITVLGLGYIGLPTSITFALAGFEVRGVDISRAVVESLSAGKIHIVEPGLQEAFDEALKSGRLKFSQEIEAPSDAYLISVQTPWRQAGEKRVAELKYVRSAAEMIARKIQPGELIVLESTVPPKTLRLVEDIVEGISGISRDEFYSAHCPERVIPGRLLEELEKNDRIIGSRTEKAALLAKELYSKVAVKANIYMTDDITAEMCKLVENTYRDVNIAYANELSTVCDRLGIDVFSLIKLANCHPRVNILTPGVGVGGHCIAVDPWFIHEQFPDETPMIENARLTNDKKPIFVAQKVSQIAPKDRPVLVLGLAYKPDIDDMRESPSLALCHELSRMGFEVIVCEPNVASGDIDGYRNTALSEGLKECGCAVITLAHRQFISAREDIRAVAHYDCVGLLND